ncbi:efflux RND transporter periplasmic adaptor subunit [Edaphobacter dinghuensis]|uniref:Transport system membrane protein n=1 Tax=Edaphobacter dinghuensis TaxID=1560005 RepID=A0A917H5L1_9BACT|nr:efflux RND transporter periplasmic adaptor subunit [Edaphobacter dinghuensis]GGG68404.1 transport system membrane protein [Edaphobacter dinghuensis]
MSSDSKEHPTTSPDHQLPAPTSEQREHQNHKGVRIIVWVVILLIFAVAFFLIMRQHATTAKKPSRRGAGGTTTITTATAQKGDIGVYLDAIGTVTPVHTASITSQVNGIVTAVHYQEGQIVRQGAPLIDIDSRTYRATLLQAQGILERDQNILAQAKMDLVRYRDAWNRNAIPKQTLDDQEKIVLQDEGTVKNDQGAVQFDQVQVDYCHITAPFTGRVGLRLVDPGNVVQSSGGTTLAVVTQIQPITAIFTIAEDNLGQVQPRLHQQAKLPVYAFDRTSLNKIATGSLLTLDNLIDTTTGTVKARALFDNKNGVLFPNEFINTRLLVNTLHDVTLIPSSAVQHNGQESFVYIIQNNVAHVRSVKPGVTDDNTTQVEGINPGDVVADSSFEKLQDNAKVIISKKPIPASTTTGSEAP